MIISPKNKNTLLLLLSHLKYFGNMLFKMTKNSVKKIRESLMMSKAELSRKANVSPITISRIEKGLDCRMETKRKIILALGYKLSDKNKIFGD